MSLSAGTRIGPYEIQSPLGEGGMGVVFRARDQKLQRDVALKLLPENFADDQERLARFQREAQVLAALNHPNIAHIYGVEDRALVMELVEGESPKGPMPFDEAWKIASQIAQALEYAHEKGIVHRDLKPANVKVTPDGIVKLLDFGLAKAFRAETTARIDPENSPTLSLAATQAGMIFGTAAYMAPEQAKGKEVDKRADIWSFGVVLYELLTGERLFKGEDVSEILAHVLTQTPDLSRVPVQARKLLSRCLEKDPKKRLRDIGEAQHLLEEASVVAPGPSERVKNKWYLPALGLLVVVMTVVAIVAGVGWWRATRPVERSMIRFSIDLGPDAVAGQRVTAVLSPDGTRMVFPIRSSAGTQLAMRILDQPKAIPLSGTEGGADPFFSPDGKWIGFFANNRLKKIAIQGGAALTLCDATNDRGGAWGTDGTIIFATNGVAGLMRVPDSGGTPQAITKPVDSGDRNHRWPQFLPDGQSLLITTQTAISRSFDDANIEVVSLKTSQKKTIVRGGYFGRYLPTSNTSGHILYVHQGTMFAVPFDAGLLETRGTPAPILEDVAALINEAGGQFDFSPAGTLVYLSGKASASTYPIFWMDSAGQTTPLSAAPGIYAAPRFSLDGKRLAYTAAGSKSLDVWIYDLERSTPLQLASDVPDSREVVWAPDGKHVVYTASAGDKAGGFGLWWARSDGSSAEHPIMESSTLVRPQSFSPDGKRLAFFQIDTAGSPHIFTAALDLTNSDHPKMGKPERFLDNPTTFDVDASFSPDGRWIAYSSGESGASNEVFVRPFPASGGKWKISTAGGKFPVWTRDGHELFFLGNDDRIMVTDYTMRGDAFIPGKPRMWSEKQILRVGPTVPSFDVAPDGKRVAMFPHAGTDSDRTAASQHVTVLLNFFDELGRRIPAK